jgi:hypothetical protein
MGQVLIAGLSLAVGCAGLFVWPFPWDDLLIGLIAREAPRLCTGLGVVYAGLWFAGPWLLLTLGRGAWQIHRPRSWSRDSFRPLPLYPRTASDEGPCLVLGEHHYDTRPDRAEQPSWLVIPERGLYTGVMIVGAVGTGKTSACIHPFVRQLLAYRADDPTRRLGGLLLEVKGDFCHTVREVLEELGRGEDYVELSLDGLWSYNLLASDLDPYALAYGIASVLINLYGHSDEPFWMQAYTNLVRFVIALFRTLDDYVTMFDVYRACIDPELMRARIAEGVERFRDGGQPRVRVSGADYKTHLAGPASPWRPSVSGSAGAGAGSDSGSGAGPGGAAPGWFEHDYSAALVGQLTRDGIAHEVIVGDERLAHRAEQFQAVRRWFEHDWSRIDNKLRSSIVEGISVFLSLFDDPAVKPVFCPVRDAAPVPGLERAVRRPLPPIGELIESGRFLALNLPVAMNPGLARAIGVALKQDFQRAVLNRIPRIARQPARHARPVLFVSDEYQTFATTGESNPSGDEKFFSLSRQGKCIPIVATQSFSSLRSTLAGESWRTLAQAFRTKVFLTLSDDFSMGIASALCGHVERRKASYTLTEAGHQTTVSLMTARPAASRATMTAAKGYRYQFEPTFQPRAFSQLRNAQAIVLGYDGLTPWPPTYCWLKPHHLDVQTSYFDHLAAGRL